MFFSTNRKHTHGDDDDDQEDKAEAIKGEVATNGQVQKKKPQKAAPVESVSEYVAKLHPKPVEKAVTVLDKEIEKEMEQLDHEVDFLVAKKIKDFSFEVKPVLQHFPEVDEMTEII